MPGVGMYVIDVGGEARRLLAGPGAFSRRSSPIARPSTWRPTWAAWAAAGQRTVELYLEDPGTPPQAKDRAAHAPAGEAEHVEFRCEDYRLGTHQGFVRIVGRTAWPPTTSGTSRRSEAGLEGVARGGSQPVAKKALFPPQALAPMLRRGASGPYDCDVVSVDELGSKPLAGYAAVLVVDPPPLAHLGLAEAGPLCGRRAGRGRFLGRNAQPLEAFNQPAAQELLAGPLVRQVRRDRDDDSPTWPRRTTGIRCWPQLRRQDMSIPWDTFPVHSPLAT